jgi:hypothetical protein
VVSALAAAHPFSILFVSPRVSPWPATASAFGGYIFIDQTAELIIRKKSWLCARSNFRIFKWIDGDPYEARVVDYLDRRRQ